MREKLQLDSSQEVEAGDVLLMIKGLCKKS